MKINYKLVAWLAYKEFFVKIFSSDIENKWDFPRLILLLGLTMSLTFFAIGTQHSLSNKFAAVLLGELPKSGIPIWINANNLDGGSGIDKAAIVAASKKYNFHPYEDVDASTFRLPSCDTNDNRPFSKLTCKLWQAQNSQKAIFSGIAVFSDDPLWKHAFSNEEAEKLSIILSKKNFKKYFIFDEYRKEMLSRLPKKYANKLPITKEDFYAEDKNSNIWVSLGKTSDTRLLVKMKIKWVDYIRTQGDYSFLLPMSIYNSLNLSKYGDVKHYYPESFSNLYISKVILRYQNIDNLQDQYFKQLSICGSERKSEINNVLDFSKKMKNTKLTNCFQNANAKGRDNENSLIFLKKNTVCKEKIGDMINIRYSLKPAKSESWVEQCLKQNNINDCRSSGRMKSDLCFSQIQPISTDNIAINYIRAENGIYQYHIDRGDSSQATQAIVKQMNITQQNKQKEGINELVKFYHAFIYINDVNKLSESITDLKEFNNKPFNFHDMYEDSLNRFNILQKILDVLGTYYLIIMGMFSLILLIIKFWVIIDHRKQNYITYMAKGMNLKSIQLIVSLQAFAASLFALVLSFTIIEVFSYCMASSIEKSLEPYSDMLNNTYIDLLPISGLEYGAVFLVSLLISLSVCWTILWINLRR